ncbi:MAG: hypothetical protein ACI9VR_000478 [Cognaticolwellia sp.]|jgi:hypothetical protein
MILLLSLACTGPRQGIAVGNPGDGVAVVSKTGGLTLNSAQAQLSSLDLIACDGTLTQVASGIGLPLDGSATLLLPGGSWCGLSMSFEQPIELDYSSDSANLYLSLDTQPEPAEGAAFALDGGVYLMELGGPEWLAEQAAALLPGEDVEIGPGDVEHDVLAATLDQWLRVGQDADGDETLSASEATIGSSGTYDDDDDDDETEEE